jgi:cobalt-zinc-cadmium efflux system membrane fusion protein
VKTRRITIGIVLVALAAAALFWVYPRVVAYLGDGASASVAKTAAPAITNELRFAVGSPQLNFIKVEAVVLLPEPLLDPLSARIAYDEDHTARVSSPIAGRVTRILVQPGDRVAAGQLLAVLDAPDFAAAVADLDKSAADFQLKQRAHARAGELLQAGVIARKDFEVAESDMRQSEAENTRARQRLRNLDRGLNSNASSGYELRSPISGVVAERSINPGVEARPDLANPLFVITDPSHLWVIVDLPERNLGAVHVKQDVIVEVDAYADMRFEARVSSIGEVLDPSTRRVQVRCTLDNPKRLLKPEMYARVTPLTGKQNLLPRIANSSLITEGLYSFVFVEKEPGVFERKRVELGLQGRSVSYVKAGLAEGDRVVTGGALLLNSELAGVD